MNLLESKIAEAIHFRKLFLHLLAYEEDAEVEDHFVAWDKEYERLTALRGMLQ